MEFNRLRAAPPFYSEALEAMQRGDRERREVLGDPVLAIPGSRASTWPRSWKRFLIDYMYGRGDVMLYPSAPRNRISPLSFSTTYMEKGDHSGTDGKVEANFNDTLRPRAEYDLRKTVPLVQSRHAAVTRKSFDALPGYLALPVVGLHHRRVTGLEVLRSTGRSFVSMRAAAAVARSSHAARPGEDDRPATRDRVAKLYAAVVTGTQEPTEAEYAVLARTWMMEAL